MPIDKTLYAPTEQWEYLIIHPCKWLSETEVMKCKRSEAQFWTVYAVLSNGYENAISDRATEQEAADLLLVLMNIVGQHRQSKDALAVLEEIHNDLPEIGTDDDVNGADVIDILNRYWDRVKAVLIESHSGG